MSTAEAWRTARRIAHATGAGREAAAETVSLADATGRVLAGPVHALTPLPGFDTAAMDGFAVAGAGPWELVGRVLAGVAGADRSLRPGQAIEIATGAPVPAGTDAVLPYEVADVRDEAVQPARLHRTHIRRAGEEAAVGDVLLMAGRTVVPAGLALAAAAGHDTLQVRVRPPVAVIVTGDEVVDAGLPRRGQVRDALGPALPGMLTAAGAVAGAVVRVPDAAHGLRDVIDTAAGAVVLVSGSSSVGPADHLEKCLLDLGAECVIASVACSPGRTQSLWRLPDGRVLVGLPGNPFAAVVAFVTLVGPIVDGMLGRPLAAPATVGRCAVTPHPSRTRLVPVIVDGDVATPCAHDGSAMLRGIATADALAVIEPGAEPGCGARVHLVPIPGGAR